MGPRQTVWVGQIMTAIIGILAAIVLTAAAVQAVELEEGATFEGGVCWEADGTEGVAALDGQCVTPADYDELYSYEALAATPLHGNTGQTVAEAYGITEDSPKASVRARSFMGSVEPTFVEYVAIVHGRQVL